MTGRLILAIISTIFEEAALVVIWLWGLPQLGIRLSLAVLVAVTLAWGAFSVAIYRAGSRALKRKAMVGLPDMIGSRGKVASSLEPEGLVKIKSELWGARSAEGKIDKGEVVTVVGQDGLMLTVRRASAASSKAAVS